MKQRRIITALTLLSICLAISIVALGVVHGLHVRRCRNEMSSKTNEPTDVADSTPKLPQTPPFARFVKISAPYPANNTNSTEASPEGKKCEAGTVWGGAMLDDLNHEYMPLMQKTLSRSPPGLAGEIRDYYHTALSSVFRCGRSMAHGELQLVVACRSNYIVDGDYIHCNESGSYANATLVSN